MLDTNNTNRNSSKHLHVVKVFKIKSKNLITLHSMKKYLIIKIIIIILLSIKVLTNYNYYNYYKIIL